MFHHNATWGRVSRQPTLQLQPRRANQTPKFAQVQWGTLESHGPNFLWLLWNFYCSQGICAMAWVPSTKRFRISKPPSRLRFLQKHPFSVCLRLKPWIYSQPRAQPHPAYQDTLFVTRQTRSDRWPFFGNELAMTHQRNGMVAGQEHIEFQDTQSLGMDHVRDLKKCWGRLVELRCVSLAG